MLSSKVGKIKFKELVPEIPGKDSLSECITPRGAPEGEGYDDILLALLGNSSDQTSKQGNDTDGYELSADELRELIRIKSKKRAINCQVLIGDSEGKNLIELIEQLKTVSPQRVQVLYKLEGNENEHWSALDILVDKNTVKVFYLDAAGDPRHLKPITQAILNCPNAELTYCEAELQHDGFSCSIFALDHAFHLSKIPDLHEQVAIVRAKVGACDIIKIDRHALDGEVLSDQNVFLVPTGSNLAFVIFEDKLYYIDKIMQKCTPIHTVSKQKLKQLSTALSLSNLPINQYKSLSAKELSMIRTTTFCLLPFSYNKLYEMNPMDLPPVLVKNAQSLRFLKRYRKKHPEQELQIINKRGQNLSNYLLNNSYFWRTKKFNLGIQEKQASYKHRIDVQKNQSRSKS